MSSNAASNAFASAARSAANHDFGDKGANQYKSTENLMLDAFLGLKQTSTPEFIKSTIDELVAQVGHLHHFKKTGLWLADLFRLWVHKRHPRSGEKEKLLGRHMFLALYDHFPQTCLDLVRAHIFADMAYWKDCLLIWGMINEQTSHGDKAKFDKYNPLIEAFRESMMSQRTTDLTALDEFVKPQRIRDIPKDKLVAMLQADGAKLPSITWIGKYCVRESSAENKRLCWWVLDDTTGRLIRQSHSPVLLFAAERALDLVPSEGSARRWGWCCPPWE